ncbi:MAG: hypothetical protein QM756_24420 [Polyangiaceae bacterium]
MAAFQPPRASEVVSLGTLASLSAYALLFVCDLAGDGGGWMLAMLGYAFVLWAAPCFIALAALLALVSHRKRTRSQVARAWLFAGAALALEYYLRTAHGFVPRGPLG